MHEHFDGNISIVTLTLVRILDFFATYSCTLMLFKRFADILFDTKNTPIFKSQISYNNIHCRWTTKRVLDSHFSGGILAPPLQSTCRQDMAGRDTRGELWKKEKEKRTASWKKEER